MELKGSKTEMNLLAAFAGESQARTKYWFYAAQARKDAGEQVAQIFEETTRNETAHARLWFRLLNGEAMPPTRENLADAAAGEHYEWTQMYADFARTAEEEGFSRIAFLFREVGKIERRHDARFTALLEDVQKGRLLRREAPTAWICTNCGYIYTGETPPEACPVCAHPQSAFEEHTASF